MPRRVSCPWFVGRTAELGTLTAALDEVLGGACRTVLIGGDAGIGKSRLASEVGARATTAGAEVLVGACMDLADGGAPYAAINEVLARLGRSVSSQGGAPSDELLDAIRQLTAERPVVLVLEDVHWSDRSTQDLLVRLARGPAVPRLLVLATYRSDDALPRGHPLRRTLAELDRSDRVERVRLDGLGPADLLAQLEGIFDGRPDEDTVRAVLERSDGSPLLAEELAAAASSGGQVSIGLHELLLSRFDRLSPPTQDVLRVAAVGGRRVGHRLLAAVVEASEQELTAALREAVSSHILLVDGDHYLFRHALLHSAIADDALPGERARLHDAFATAIERGPALVDGERHAALVHHWSGAGRAGPALRAAVEAAARAEAAYARPEAQRFWEVALAAWDDALGELGTDEVPITHDELLHRAADNASRAGDVERAAELVEIALASVDPRAERSRAALLHERRGWCLLQAGRVGDALAAYEHAVELVPVRPPTVARARVLAAYADALHRAGDAAAAASAGRAITAAVAARSPADEGHARHTLGACLLGRGDHDGGLEQLALALDLAEAGGDVADAVGVHRHLWRELVSAGRPGELVERAQVGADDARARSMPVLAGVLDGLAAGYCHELGRWDEAEALLARIEPTGLPGIVRLLVGGLLDVDRGRLDVAGDALETVRGLTYGLRDGRVDGLLHRGLAERALWRDRPAEAVAIVDAGLERTTDVELAAWLTLVGLRAASDGDTPTAPSDWPTCARSSSGARAGARSPPSAPRGRPRHHVWPAAAVRRRGRRHLATGARSASRCRSCTRAGAMPRRCSPPVSAMREPRS